MKTLGYVILALFVLGMVRKPAATTTNSTTGGYVPFLNNPLSIDQLFSLNTQAAQLNANGTPVVNSQGPTNVAIDPSGDLANLNATGSLYTNPDGTTTFPGGIF